MKQLFTCHGRNAQGSLVYAVAGLLGGGYPQHGLKTGFILSLYTMMCHSTRESTVASGASLCMFSRCYNLKIACITAKFVANAVSYSTVQKF